MYSGCTARLAALRPTRLLPWRPRRPIRAQREGSMDSHDVVRNTVGKSPYGEADEIGRLNLITPQSRARALGRADASRVYDLSVELFMGMPAWCAFGEPTYQIWMNH